MEMPGRKIVSDDHRYGFQSQEKDAELWNGAVSYKYRIEDPRLGRFFSIDPLAAKYPHNSVYAFSENRVIDGVELEGLEFINYYEARVMVQSNGSVHLKLSNCSEAYQEAWDRANFYYAGGENVKGHVYTDPTGGQHIGGLPTKLANVEFPMSKSSEFSKFIRENSDVLEDMSNDLKEKSDKALSNTRYKNNSNELDGRYNGTKNYNQIAAKAKGLALFQVAALGYSIYSDMKRGFFDIPDIKADNDAIKSQMLSIEQAAGAMNTFLKNNSVNPAVVEGEGSNNLFRYVLTGEKIGSDDRVFQLGDSILDSNGMNQNPKIDKRFDYILLQKNRH